MAPYFGLRGERLSVACIFLVVVPSFLLFGYNQSALGGVLAFESFTSAFPQIDTTNAEAAAKAHNSTVQGESSYTIYTEYLIRLQAQLWLSTRWDVLLAPSRALLLVTASDRLVLQASSYGLSQMIVGRLVSGFGVGSINTITPVWQSECSKPKNRGKHVVVLGSFIATGIAAAAWVNYGLSYVQDSSVSWRLPLAIPLVFTAILAVSAFCVPESPRWLVQKARYAEAREVLSILEDFANEDDVVRTEVEAIRQACEAESHREVGFRTLISTGPKRLFYRTMLAFLINFNAQMTGANVISYYSTTIFRESLGFPSRSASLLAAGVLTWKIVTASFAFLTVDRFGRRPLFMVSGLGMSVSMTCLSVCVSRIGSPAAGGAAVFFLFLFMSFFPLGILGANFLYATEISPQDLRVHLAAVGTATHWLFNFVIAEITPICFNNIGYRMYIIYAVTGAVVLPTVYFLFPETKGRSLEEIGQIFEGAQHWWQVPKTADSAACDVVPAVDAEDNMLKDGKGAIEARSLKIEAECITAVVAVFTFASAANAGVLPREASPAPQNFAGCPGGDYPTCVRTFEASCVGGCFGEMDVRCQNGCNGAAQFACQRDCP
ncbi:hypothetical protein VTN00DRAFT_6 [Thermoascus crustaceus]|uniref:uncharacterized protein n=1 Tax=Thermoascus crustaceus TaxID=5088 RepID=UPI0037443D4D